MNVWLMVQTRDVTEVGLLELEILNIGVGAGVGVEEKCIARRVEATLNG